MVKSDVSLAHKHVCVCVMHGYIMDVAWLAS